jgi:DNA-binding MarR family transcriptional regulator
VNKPVGHLIQRLGIALERAADGILRQHLGVSFSRFYCLTALAHFDEVTQHDLAVAVGYTDPSISTMVMELHRDDLVAVRQSAEHRRKRLVSLTPQGRELVTRGSGLLEEHLAELMKVARVDVEAYGAMTERLLTALLNKKMGQPT